MLCVEPNKYASKKELALRAELARYRKLEKNCWKTWETTGVKNAFKWNEKAYALLGQIRALEYQNKILVKKLNISRSEIDTFNKVNKIKVLK